MKIGINLPQIGQHATKDNVLHIAREAEKEGFDSVWTFDRILRHHIEELQMDDFQSTCKMYLIQ